MWYQAKHFKKIDFRRSQSFAQATTARMKAISTSSRTSHRCRATVENTSRMCTNKKKRFVATAQLQSQRITTDNGNKTLAHCAPQTWSNSKLDQHSPHSLARPFALSICTRRAMCNVPIAALTALWSLGTLHFHVAVRCVPLFLSALFIRNSLTCGCIACSIRRYEAALSMNGICCFVVLALKKL